MKLTPDVRAVAAMWALLLLPLAASTLVLRAAVYLPLSFLEASQLFLVTSLLLVLAWADYARLHLSHLFQLIKRADRVAIYLALAACVLAGVAATCLHRADADDAIYLPKVVHYLSLPKTPMDGSIYEIANARVLAFPRAAATYYPTGYEFAQAAVSLTTGIDFLSIYYVLAPWLAAVIGMLALMMNMRSCGASPRAAAYSGVLLVPLILLLGEAHRSYGNLSLARAFQSKFAFFLFGLPIFLSLSLAFFRARDITTWLCLLIVVMALGGMTTSTLVMLPLLAVVLLTAWCLTCDDPRGTMKMGSFYALAMLPVFFLALDYRRYATAYVSFGSALNAGFPKTFAGQFALLEQGAAVPVSLVIFGAALIVCLVKAKRNAFLLSWTLLTILLYLNPYTAPWIMRYATSENIYWRLFYVLPFPLIVGVACAQVIDGLPLARGRPWHGATVVLMCSLGLLLSPTSVLRSENGTRIGSPGPTMDELASDALAIAKIAPAGVVLAPIAVAQDMAILSTRHTQVATRADFMANAFRDQPDEVDRRLRAAMFVAGGGGHIEDLVKVIQYDKPTTIVLSRGALSPAALEVLMGAGLHQVGDVGPWVIFARR